MCWPISRALTFAVLLAFSGAAFAQTKLDAAVLAYVRGDYPAALEQFVLLAYQGEAEAQYYLGQMYENGFGVRPDQEAAVRWYRAAAEQEHDNARTALARLDRLPAPTAADAPDLASALEAYRAGDYATAQKQFAALAEQGDPEAQYHLALIYAEGTPGTARDYGEAVRWLRQAAEQGHVLAQYRLGLAYERGNGVARDAVEAARWYRRAADRDNVEARFALRRVDDAATFETAVAAYERGDYQTAYPQFRELAKGGNTRAHYFLGLLHDRGQGVAQDPAEAARWYRRAAQADDTNAQFNLAALYDQGRGVPQDDNLAYRWYSRARAHGHPEAEAAIERLIHRHSSRLSGGVSGAASAPVSGLDAASAAYERRDYIVAAERFLALARHGNAAAQYRLGSMYKEGLGVATDAAEARRWYRAAAEQGDAMAQLALARSYGGYFLGAVPDYAEAARWYREAAEQGNPQAQTALGHAYRDGKGVARDGAESARWYRAARRAAAGVDRLMPSSCAAAADVVALAEVHAACRRGESEAALESLTRLARQGHAAAQTWLAFLHYTGREIPVPQNVHEGARWYRAAARQGDVTAQYNLGVVYEHGMGVAADRAKAIRWYRAAADRGDPHGRAALQLLQADPGAVRSESRAILAALHRGEDDKALHALATLANRGDAEAQALIGALYLTGRHVPRNYANALNAYEAAAAQDHRVAEYFLGLMHEHGLGVAADRAEAIRWYEAAAEDGDEAATAALERLEE